MGQCLRKSPRCSDQISFTDVAYANRQRGRKPKALETTLRMYLLQAWFSLSDEGVEDAIYDSYAMPRFLGLNCTVEQGPDATTLLHVPAGEARAGQQTVGAAGGDVRGAEPDQARRQHRGRHDDRRAFLAEERRWCARSRDDLALMGNQWFGGMKAHIGVEPGTG